MAIFNSVYKSFTPTQIFEYSYNFVWTTTSQMETDGWVFRNNKNYATFNTNWINTTSPDKAIDAEMENLTSIVPTAKKITISSTAVFTGRLRNNCLLYNGYSSWFTGRNWGFASSAENRIGFYKNNTMSYISMTVSWNMTQTMIMDLENWTYSISATNGYSDSWTLSSSDIAAIRGGKWISISTSYWWGGNSSWWTTSLSLEIEY